MLGIFQTTLQYIFFYIGLAYTTGIRSSIINGTGAFFSILLAHFIYKNDRLNVNKIVGCIVGFIGVIIVNLNGQDFFQVLFPFKVKALLCWQHLFFQHHQFMERK